MKPVREHFDNLLLVTKSLFAIIHQIEKCLIFSKKKERKKSLFLTFQGSSKLIRSKSERMVSFILIYSVCKFNR